MTLTLNYSHTRKKTGSKVDQVILYISKKIRITDGHRGEFHTFMYFYSFILVKYSLFLCQRKERRMKYFHTHEVLWVLTYYPKTGNFSQSTHNSRGSLLSLAFEIICLMPQLIFYFSGAEPLGYFRSRPAFTNGKTFPKKQRAYK